ncbi:MAG TPA: hypothetical protein VMS18_08515 [Candidatus Binatia bacterium]|nr:hypothetical protein [Candidatus Binatia bacterium]
MRTHGVLKIVSLCLLLNTFANSSDGSPSAPSTRVDPIYFAFDDFSTTMNPAGTWTYGYTSHLGSPFFAYTTSGTTTSSNEIGWFGPLPASADAPGFPLVVVSQSGQPKNLDMLPGPGGEYSVVRWTAPSAGLWDVSGEFDGQGSTSSDVHVLSNERCLFSRNVNNADAQVFALTLSLHAGDRVDFAVGFGLDGSPDSDNTRLRAIILPHAYDYSKIDFPGASQTQVFGFNDYGTIVGNYTDTQGAVHAFVYRAGSYQTIDHSDSVENGFLGINNDEHIAGYYIGTDQRYHGFVLAGSVYHNVSFPGALDTVAWDVNDFGDVVGGFDFTDQNTVIAFLDHRGSYTSFEDPVAPPGASQADALNDRGQIVGVYVDIDGNVHGFLRQNSDLLPVEFPGTTSGGEAEGINNQGQIAGRYFGGRGGSLAFIRSGSRFTTMVFPGAAICAARKINNHGTVVGIYRAKNGAPLHGFIATPTHQDH